MNEPIIRVADLGHTYMDGTPMAQVALRGVSLSVDGGGAVALVGPTGSGKSTLLQHLNGILTPQSGSVRVLGRDLAEPRIDFTALRREVGLVLQDPGQQLFERYVGDDVAFGPRTAGLSGADLTRRVRWAMDNVGLDFDQFKDRPTFALSGGERRKAGLAGVIAMKPRILLLDEPTAGLDPEAHDELIDNLGRLREQGMTLVMATHNMDDVAAIADRVVVLSRGRLALEGSVREVFGQADEIRAMGLELPAATRVVQELSGTGAAVQQVVLTLEEAEREILDLFGVGR